MKSFVKALHGCFLALLHTRKANYTYTPQTRRTIYRQDNAHRDICANSSRQPPMPQVILSCVSAGNIATEMWQGQTNWRHGRKGSHNVRHDIRLLYAQGMISDCRAKTLHGRTNKRGAGLVGDKYHHTYQQQAQHAMPPCIAAQHQICQQYIKRNPYPFVTYRPHQNIKQTTMKTI